MTSKISASASIAITFVYLALAAPTPALATTATTFALPDTRAWELVSPPNKDESGIESLSEEWGVVQAAEDGDAIAYVAAGPIPSEGHEPAGNHAFAPTQILSKRGADGWQTRDIQTPRNPAIGHGVNTGVASEYVMFSNDLSQGLLEPRAQDPLPPLAETAEESVYLRDDETGAFEPLVTAANVFEGIHSEFGKQQDSRRGDGVTAWVGTPDLRHVVLKSKEVPLVEGAAAGELYEWTAGEPPEAPLKLVSVLPDGESESAFLGRANTLFRHAVSDDGERAIWGIGGEQVATLYLRDISKGETVQVSPGEASYQTASSDGSRVFYTEGGQLYVFTAPISEGPLAGVATDLTEGVAVQGNVIGASETGEYVYVVTDGGLSPTENAGKTVLGADNENARGEKPEGEDNLYVIHYEHEQWKPTFIANLSSKDTPDWGFHDGATSPDLMFLTARVSPSGGWLAFMSQKRLTGYDNTDLVSGAADEEVYTYDVAANTTVCVSCNPTKERPTGVFDPSRSAQVTALLVDEPHAWEEHWLAASIPGWTAQDGESALYQPRYLSDDGRLFFDSQDALVPADSNGKENVYEYEPTGVGNCTTETQSPADVYSPEAEGCIGLISSGTSDEESAFLDASAAGPGGEEAEDVFFITNTRLAAQDTDSAYDVYDAHICSTNVPCPPTALTAPPACNTTDSCRAAPTPQPEVFGEPSSQTFSGNGNLAPAPPQAAVPVKPKPKTVKCHRGQVKKHNKCVKRAKSKLAKKSSKERK